MPVSPGTRLGSFEFVARRRRHVAPNAVPDSYVVTINWASRLERR